MRLPDWEIDGWRLDDGEERHCKSPETFEIPPLEVRILLEPGDFAQLIFVIDLEDEEGPAEGTERMWVIVRERAPAGHYVGMLNNRPSLIGENDVLWEGTELAFEPRHIIDALKGNAASLALALKPPPIPWGED